MSDQDEVEEIDKLPLIVNKLSEYITSFIEEP